MSSAKRRLERNSPSVFTPLFSQFNLLNMLSNVAVNSLGEMVSPSLTPLLILTFSLSLCRCTVTELSVYNTTLSDGDMSLSSNLTGKWLESLCLCCFVPIIINKSAMQAYFEKKIWPIIEKYQSNIIAPYDRQV